MQTIVALATPVGRSGIGVVRLSGDGPLDLVRSLVGDSSFSPTPRVAQLRQLFDADGGDVLDEAIVTYFKAPHSFTGEDVVEISCHGSPVLLRQVIDICLRLGARMADAGEFTLRALANGRMNLTRGRSDPRSDRRANDGRSAAGRASDARRVLASTATDQG